MIVLTVDTARRNPLTDMTRKQWSWYCWKTKTKGKKQNKNKKERMKKKNNNNNNNKQTPVRHDLQLYRVVAAETNPR